jgi:hypothetical protein
MNSQEIIEKRLERVRLPNWQWDEYVKIHFLEDGTFSPWVNFVSPTAQQKLYIEVGSQELLFSEAFGDLETWELYLGVPYRGF